MQVLGTLPRKDRHFKEVSSNWIDHPVLNCDTSAQNCSFTSTSDVSTSSPLFSYVLVGSAQHHGSSCSVGKGAGKRGGASGGGPHPCREQSVVLYFAVPFVLGLGMVAWGICTVVWRYCCCCCCRASQVGVLRNCP